MKNRSKTDIGLSNSFFLPNRPIAPRHIVFLDARCFNFIKIRLLFKVTFFTHRSMKGNIEKYTVTLNSYEKYDFHINEYHYYVGIKILFVLQNVLFSVTVFQSKCGV